MHWDKQPPRELLPSWGLRWGEADLMEYEWVSSSRGTVNGPTKSGDTPCHHPMHRASLRCEE